MTTLESKTDAICAHCSEPIRAGEQFNAGGIPMHKNCGLRGVLGSMAHLQGRCSCYVPGSTAGDPEGLTPRQAADAAVAEWKRLEALRQLGAAGPAPQCTPEPKPMAQPMAKIKLNANGWTVLRRESEHLDIRPSAANWLLVYLNFLEANGIDACACEITMPDGRRAYALRCADGKLSWRF